jgi:pentatricopeptide repeat protein
VAYNTLINGMCKKGEFVKAMKFLDIMVSKGLNPDVVTYGTLISGVCKKDEIEKAIDFFEVMILSKGLDPNVVTCSTLMDCARKVKLRRQLIFFFNS